MQQQVREFLSYFGNPLVMAKPEVEAFPQHKGSFDRSSVAWIDVLEELNKNEPYSLNFTPNGNYWEVNTKGKIQRDGKSATGNICNALCFDIDTKSHDIKDKEKLYAHIFEVFMIYKIAPNFIIDTPWGYHVYLVIKQDDRKAVNDSFGKKVFELSAFIAKLLWSDDKARCSMWVEWLARLPWSFHRKSWEPKEVTIKYAKTDVLYTYEHIEHAMRYIVDYDTMEKDRQKYSKLARGRYSTIDALRFTDLFKVLEKYPRVINWSAEHFLLQWSAINVYKTSSGQVIETDGYKLNKGQNYVNCFSSTYHDITERPRWWAFSFMCHYFNRDMNKMGMFLRDEFNIELSDQPILEEKDELVITKDDYSIQFTNKKVKMIRQMPKTIVEKDLFKIPVKIIGKWMVKIGTDFGESETENIVYIFEVNKQTILIHRYSNKKKFNDRYWSIMFFYGEDNDLGMLYEAFDSTDKVPMIDMITHNGIYGDTTILGWKIIHGKTEWVHLSVMTKFETFKWRETSLRWFLDKFRQAYDDKVAVPALLQMLALAGMNLRDEAQVFPAMLITGFTWCGKSTIVEILKNLIGYKEADRKYDIWSVTKQPLSQYACDNSILFLDELTESVQANAEQLVRTIVNRNRWGRWMADKNIFYNYKAPMCVSWERTFVSESLNNRFVCVTVSKKYWKEWGKVIMDELRGMSCINEVYSKYYENAHKLAELRLKYVARLMKDTNNSRNVDVRSYMFVVNEVFDLWISYEELLAIATHHLASMGLNDNQVISEELSLELFLTRGLVNRALFLTERDFKWKTIYDFMFMDSSYYEKNRSRLRTMVNELNDKYDWDNVNVTSYWLSIVVADVNATTYDEYLDLSMQNVCKTQRITRPARSY